MSVFNLFRVLKVMVGVYTLLLKNDILLKINNFLKKIFEVQLYYI